MPEIEVKEQYFSPIEIATGLTKLFNKNSDYKKLVWVEPGEEPEIYIIDMPTATVFNAPFIGLIDEEFVMRMLKRFRSTYMWTMVELYDGLDILKNPIKEIKPSMSIKIKNHTPVQHDPDERITPINDLRNIYSLIGSRLNLRIAISTDMDDIYMTIYGDNIDRQKFSISNMTKGVLFEYIMMIWKQNEQIEGNIEEIEIIACQYCGAFNKPTVDQCHNCKSLVM